MSSVEQLATEYLAGATLMELAERHRKPYQAIRDKLLVAGVPFRASGTRFIPVPPELAQCYEDGMNIREIAARYSLSFGTVRRRLIAAGVQLRRSGPPRQARPAATEAL